MSDDPPFFVLKQLFALAVGSVIIAIVTGLRAAERRRPPRKKPPE